MSEKRADVLSWDEYFMAVALLSAGRSKDPNTQVGACVADPKNRIVSVGYNGFPRGCADDDLPWAREGDELALSVTAGCGRYLAIGMAAVVYLMNPSVIAIGGGVAAAGEFLLHQIEGPFIERTPMAPIPTPVKLAVLGNDAGIYGAVRLVMTEGRR